ALDRAPRCTGHPRLPREHAGRHPRAPADRGQCRGGRAPGRPPRPHPHPRPAGQALGDADRCGAACARPRRAHRPGAARVRAHRCRAGRAARREGDLTMATPAATLLHLMTGYRAMQALYVAARLGIADLLKDGARGSEELARGTGADARALHRLLRALASLGVFGEDADGRFTPSEHGALLRSDVPGSLRAAAIFFGDERNWHAWGKLERSVMSGEPVRGPRGTQAFFEEDARDPEGAALFNAAMTSLTSAFDAAVTAAYDFSRLGTLVDVGGGQGALISAILAANPALRGILFDIPPVIESARRLRARAHRTHGHAAQHRRGDASVAPWSPADARGSRAASPSSASARRATSAGRRDR